jgi:hypothetical protein
VKKRISRSRVLVFISVFAAAFLGYALRPVYAATAPGNTGAGGDCAITQGDIAAIADIQHDASLSNADKVSRELDARKALLAKAIACAEGEVSKLRGTVSGVSPSDAATANIQSQLASKLDDASNYYGLERVKLADAGIVGTEQVAKEMLVWRASVLTPLADQINYFTLWSGSQPLFAAATARMAQVSRIVSFLVATNDNNLAAALGKAQASFQVAQDENSAAKNAITQSLSGDQVSALMGQSLQSLADTYQDFFSISTIIQGTVSDQGQK